MIYVISIIMFVILFGAAYLTVKPTTFRRDERNPYRRYCKACGQQQDFHTMTMASRYGWWEDMGMIQNKSCICHKYSEYH